MQPPQIPISQRRRITAIDLFSGAGGFSLAAWNCGIDVVGAVELDEIACKTYKNNIPENNQCKTRVFNENILDIDPIVFRKELNLEKNELDILLGGPPCQGFSTHRINNKGIEDPRNKLLIRYFDFVKELGPKIFLVENVPGLLWPRHSDYLQKFKNLARRHGYKIFDPVKLNAKNFGVPQNRERVFILGVRTGLTTKNFQWPPTQTHFKPGEGVPEWRTASVAFPPPPQWARLLIEEKIGLENLNRLVFGHAINPSDSSSVSMRHSEALLQRFQETPINGSRHDIEFRLPCHSEEYSGHKDVYGRIRLAQPGPTITTGCYNPSKGRFLHPWLPQGIAVRVAARIQTFPDIFSFSGGITSQAKQIGNAVPVKLGEHLIEAIKPILSNI